MKRGLMVALALVGSSIAGVTDADERPARGHVTKVESPEGYSHIVRAWHAPTPGKTAPLDAKGRPELVLHAMYVHETVCFAVSSDSGGFAPGDLARAAHALREPSSGLEHPVEPRLLDLLYRIQRRFGAHEIRVMSAFRSPTKRSRQGLHGQGRAVDFVVPGAADEDVARFARQLGFVGVGIYPLGGFVHLDARARSYFWRDKSGPRRPSRERGILADVARSSDEAAWARGELPIKDAAQRADDDEDE